MVWRAALGVKLHTATTQVRLNWRPPCGRWVSPHKDAPEKRRRSPAELAAIIQRRNEQGPLGGRFKAAADALAEQAEVRRRQARQRTRSRDRDGQRRWTVPGIVVKVGGP